MNQSDVTKDLSQYKKLEEPELLAVFDTNGWPLDKMVMIAYGYAPEGKLPNMTDNDILSRSYQDARKLLHQNINNIPNSVIGNPAIDDCKDYIVSKGDFIMWASDRWKYKETARVYDIWKTYYDLRHETVELESWKYNTIIIQREAKKKQKAEVRKKIDEGKSYTRHRKGLKEEICKQLLIELQRPKKGGKSKECLKVDGYRKAFDLMDVDKLVNEVMKDISLEKK